MAPLLVHRYRCSFCHTWAATTIKTSHPPLKCALCLRLMAFMFSAEVDEAEWQDRNSRPVEFVSPYMVASVAPELREKKCGRLTCDVRKPKNELLNGRFCSEECGAKDSVELAERLDNLRRMYAERPWYGATDAVKGIA